jgi:hypothetical protein
LQQNKGFVRNRIKADFLAPDYYKDFKCKGSDCRDSCCVDWKVTISMSQYFLLHGLNVDKELKEKIDRTFRPLLNPSQERYAEIVHTYRGNCPLHKDDGYCLLHERCGEEVLPWVCRYYPRGPKINFQPEVSCANSCEKTLELLFASNDTIKFEINNFEFMMNNPRSKATDSETKSYVELRNKIFVILSNRKFLLKDRIMILRSFLLSKENYLSEVGNESGSFKKSVDIDEEFIADYVSLFTGLYPRLDEQLTEASVVYEKNKYEELLDSFNLIVTNQEVYFEKMLVNDLFFKQFPYQVNFPVEGQVLALVATYFLLRYISIALMKNQNNIEGFIDIVSKTFTVTAHSVFDRQIANLMREKNLIDHNSLIKILSF